MLMLPVIGMDLVVSTLVGLGVDAIVLDGNVGRLNHIAFYVIGLFAAMVAIGYFRNYLFGITNASVLDNLRRRILHHLVGLGHDFYKSSGSPDGYGASYHSHYCALAGSNNWERHS